MEAVARRSVHVLDGKKVFFPGWRKKTCPKPIFSRFFPLFAVQNPGVFSGFFPLLASHLLVFPIILQSNACLENAINT